jgi:AcrR family transcriptional regulator
MDDDPATEIPTATHRALRGNGYADHTIQEIAAASDASKAAVHYHCDTKDDLLAPVPESLYCRYTDRLDAVPGTTASGRLVSLVDSRAADERASVEFRTAMLAVRPQAPMGAQTRRVVVDRATDPGREAVARNVDAQLVDGGTPEVTP